MALYCSPSCAVNIGLIAGFMFCIHVTERNLLIRPLYLISSVWSSIHNSSIPGNWVRCPGSLSTKCLPKCNFMSVISSFKAGNVYKSSRHLITTMKLLWNTHNASFLSCHPTALNRWNIIRNQMFAASLSLYDEIFNMTNFDLTPCSCFPCLEG